MKEQLSALLNLAEIDSEINSLREIKDARPKQLEPFKGQVTQKEGKFNLLKDECHRLRIDSDKTDQEIRSKEDKIKKLEIQLNTAKSNDEFQVLRDQITKLKEEVGECEEKRLELLSKIEQLQEELKRLEEESKEAQTDLRIAENETTEEVAQINQRLNELELKRKNVKEAVDHKYLAQYDRVLERHRDRALVAVEGNICQGCYMSVTPQMINMLILGEEIVQCKSCQRILYMPE